jgi:hypothetical protein
MHVFIINLLVVYRCINNYTIEVVAVCQVMARVFWPSGPTHGEPPCSFSPSSIGVVPLVPNLVRSPPPLECLTSEVTKCCILFGTIGRVTGNLAECHEVNAPYNFK